METHSSQALTCDPTKPDDCCIPTDDDCGVRYGKRINDYLGFEAKSNGACTEGVSGVYQCAAFAKNFYIGKLNHEKCSNGTNACKGFSHQWTPLRNKRYVNEALDVEASHPNSADPLFVFQTENSGWNSTAELPRETDILVFENGGAGHFVVAKAPKKVSSNEFHVRIIEQNVAALPDYGPDGSCHNRVLVATKQGNGKWSIPSGIGSSYVYAGFIRHNLAGIYGDNGWHDDGTSRAFRNAYLRYENGKLGWAFDNGGGPFVHESRGLLLQDFVNTGPNHFGTDGQTAIVLAPNRREAFILREGFWGAYKCLLGSDGEGMGGAEYLGAPLGDEHSANIIIDEHGNSGCVESSSGTYVQSFQRFERGCVWYKDQVDDTVHAHLSNGTRISDHALAHARDECHIAVDNNPPGPDCINDCSPGDQECSGTRALRICGHPAQDSCYHWIIVDCAPDFVCANNDCVAPASTASCPNGACDHGETCASCQDDCCPSAPTITSPVSGSSWAQGNSVPVSWTESADAKRYMLAFCRDAQYADCPSLVDGIDIGLTQYQMSGLSTGTWYVSVRAIPWDESGWGHYSAPVQFSVIAGNSGGAPVEIALPDNPSDGGTNEINPAPSCDNQCTEGIDCYDDRTMGDCLGPTDDIPCTHWLNSRTCEEHWTCVRGQGCVPCGSSGQVCCVLEEPCRNGRMCLGSGLCTIVCDADADGHLIPDCGGDDCDDMSAVRYPGRTESCDGLDNDCDGQTDEGYDLLSDPDNCGACQNTCRRPYALCACVNGTCSFTGCESGRTNANGSWDDGCEAVSPTCTESLWYRDADADGYGTPASSVSECSAPNGYVSSSEDCNDADPGVHPSASESCNNRDDDCDGQVDEGIASLGACTSGTGACARTGQLVCRSGAVQCDAIAGSPSAEICANGIDEDCDGTADEGCSTVCDPSDITCSSCYEPVRTGEFMTCLDEQGRLFYLMSAFSYEESPIPNGDASRNPWHAYIWLEAATSAPWWIELDLMPVSGITGAAYAQLTSDLPAGLCPFTDGSYRHPIRVSNPYPGTYDENGWTFARDGSMHVCGDSQPGLTARFEYLDDCAIAVERDAASGEWLPAAERAEDDMTGGRIHCVP